MVYVNYTLVKRLFLNSNLLSKVKYLEETIVSVLAS